MNTTNVSQPPGKVNVAVVGLGFMGVTHLRAYLPLSAAHIVAVCDAVRAWALTHAHEYALIYGSPVPGYQAPQDTIGPATRVILLMASIVRDAMGDGAVTAGPPISGRYAEELAAVAAQLGENIPPQVVGATFAAFVQQFRRDRARGV